MLSAERRTDGGLTPTPICNLSKKECHSEAKPKKLKGTKDPSLTFRMTRFKVSYYNRSEATLR